MRIHAILLAAAAGCAALPAHAQTSHDLQAWGNLTVLGRVTGDLVYFAEVQPRVTDDLSRVSQILLRPAIGVAVSQDVTVYQGYARVLQPVAGGGSRDEDRSFQQVSWTIQRGAREWQSRTRFEQRWNEVGDDTGFRLRQMIRYEHALDEAGGPALLGSIEGFVALNDTDWGARGGFDQLRTFVGAELPLPGASTVEAGYLNQLVDGAGTTRIGHTVSVALFIRH
ncbi:DUF2490 domain-containing protein [Croceibacterium sp. TMG7-5b_MA50]|uniref:DUF2490 domain-containing protein n=1 Tax=Croceibacterium sp. TMG7-5b_MA50 TaxID=3121290 RepID=UPI003221F0D0